MKRELIYFDTYVLQKDLRIRIPKNILANMNIDTKKITFDIYLDSENNEIILRPNSIKVIKENTDERH